MKEVYNKKKRFIKLRWQLLFIFLPIAIIPLIIVIAFGYNRIFTHLEKESRNFYLALLKQLSNNLDYIYNQYARTLSNILEIKEVVDELNSPPYKNEIEEIESSKRMIGDVNTRGGLRNTMEEKIEGKMYVIELDRYSIKDQTNYKIHLTVGDQVIPNIRNLLSDPLFLTIKNNNKIKMIFGKFQKKVITGIDENNPVIIYPYYSTPPVNNSDTFSKFLLVVLNKEFLLNLYKDIDPIKFGTFYMLDRFNNVITYNHPCSDDYYYFDENSKKYILGNDPVVVEGELLTFYDYQLLNVDPSIIFEKELQDLIKNIKKKYLSNEIMEEKKNYKIIKYNNINYLTLVDYAKFSEITFVYLHPINKIQKPILNVLYGIIIITIVIILFVFIITILLSKYLTTPIQILYQSAIDISKGNYDIIIKVDSNNEIGILADAFNKMISQIKNYASNLENLVNERTQQLQKANEDLKILNYKLEEKNTFKSQYLANMSHELRTPLNSILGCNQLILYENFNSSFDISEINDNIIEKLKNDVNNNIVYEIIKFCKSFKEYIFSKDIGMQYYYYYELKNLIDKLPEQFENKKILNDYLDDIKYFLDSDYNGIKNSLRSIKRNGEYLLELINTILDISRIEAGKLSLIINSVNVKEFMNNIMEDATSYLKNKRKDKILSLNIFYTDSVPDIIYIDKYKIKQILLNLISNAIKFTEKGAVIVKVDCDDKNIYFSVIDTGIGIKSEDIPLLFREFSRSTTVSNIEGTGLGLAFSKKLAELHNGKINVKSEFGSGSEFTLQIPLNILTSNRK